MLNSSGARYVAKLGEPSGVRLGVSVNNGSCPGKAGIEEGKGGRRPKDEDERDSVEERTRYAEEPILGSESETKGLAVSVSLASSRMVS